METSAFGSSLQLRFAIGERPELGTISMVLLTKKRCSATTYRNSSQSASLSFWTDWALTVDEGLGDDAKETTVSLW
jgi:hypothetical protein